ncbi:MAG TPA: M23 family metallopeptidase [Agromyces sp.]|nr:M23 family metallopeptidase [Agromyces sp.]
MARTPHRPPVARRRPIAWRSSLLAATLGALIMAAPAAAAGAGAQAAVGAARALGGGTGAGVAHQVSGEWSWPVNPPLVVIAPFLAPPTPYSAGHRGIDIATVVGAQVLAPAPGVVTFAGPVAGRRVLVIDHGDGLVSAVEPVGAAVDVGASVGAGDPVGDVATGGHCEARCVHFGVRLHGEYVSPLLFLGGVPRAVLLPLP